MGHVVDFFKVNPQLTSLQIDDVLDDKKYHFTFKQFVDRNNIEKRSLQNSLDAYAIVQKIKTDLYQLDKDDWMELLLWLKETACEAYKNNFDFEDPQVSAHLSQYSLVSVERIGDREHSFSFTYGDFVFDYYNDFYDEQDNKIRESCCLSADDYKKFIIYGLHLFAKILLKEKPAVYASDDGLISIVDSEITDEKLDKIITDNLEYITENKDGRNMDVENIADFVGYAGYWCDLSEFEYLYYKFQTLWKDYKDNDMSVIMLS